MQSLFHNSFEWHVYSPQSSCIVNILNIVVYANRWVLLEPSQTIGWFYWKFPKSILQYCECRASSGKKKTISIIFTCCIKVLYHGILYDLVVKSFTYIGFSSHPPLIFVMWSFKIFGVFKLVIFVKSLLKLFYDPIVIWGTI